MTDESDATATEPQNAIHDLVGHYVVIRHVGPGGCLTVRSYVTDVSIDGTEVEVAASPGHLFPLSAVAVAH